LFYRYNGFDVLFLFSVFSFLFQSLDPTGNKIIKEVEIPESNYKAVVFFRDAGATTGISTHLSIIKKNESLKNRSGNIFITEGRFDIECMDNKVFIINRTSGEIYKKKVYIMGLRLFMKAGKTETDSISC